MTINLTDDGTMDTVLRCSECSEEFRGTYDSSFEQNENPTETQCEAAYVAWVETFREEVEQEHDCADHENEEVAYRRNPMTTVSLTTWETLYWLYCPKHGSEWRSSTTAACSSCRKGR